MKPRAGYQSLKPERIEETLEQLRARIAARFPNAGLLGVCGELVDTAHFVARDARALSRPAWLWRLGAIAFLVAGIAAQIWALGFFHLDGFGGTATDLIQGLDSAVNLLILFGGATWFLMNLEARRKRNRALDALHRLRSLAHVIDMHQLTKDPTVLLSGANRTAVSPERTMSRFELTRYLDYCAEMESLIGKLAALYGEHMRDSAVIAAVNDIENLTNGIGRKIWQKITLLGVLDDRAAPSSSFS